LDAVARENKEQAVYALVVGKNGSKLHESTAEADTLVPDTPGSHALYTPQGDGRMLENGGFVLTDGAYGPMRGGRGPKGGMKIEFLKLTMPGLADVLAPHVERPVVDMTNLKGGYYFASERRPSGRRTGWRRPRPRPTTRSPRGSVIHSDRKGRTEAGGAESTGGDDRGRSSGENADRELTRSLQGSRGSLTTNFSSSNELPGPVDSRAEALSEPH
jgi:uncharacterized protein (TIGR03435 family)